MPFFRTIFRTILVSLLSVGALCSSSWAESITVQPPLGEGDDVSLYERTNLPLSGGLLSLYVINTGPPGPGFDDFTSLVAFDLSGVSQGASSVAQASLFLYENDVLTASFVHPTSAFPDQITVEAAAGPWSPTGTLFSTIPDTVPGFSTTTEVNAVNTWFEWDVTEIVRGWLDGSFENHGLVINSAVETRTPVGVVGSAFDSFELPNRPRLEIEFVPEPSTLCLCVIGIGALFVAISSARPRA